MLLCLFGLPGQALAQDGSEQPPEDVADDSSELSSAEDAEEPPAGDNGFVEPTDEQADLNTEAVKAIKDENYGEAVELLRESLEIGELNITFLNLGRAHQRLDECGSAKSAYLEALSAPQVEQPSPYLIEKKVEEYLTELEEQCSESEWGKQSEGTAGSGEYTWDPRPAGASPMLRLGLGLGTGTTQSHLDGDLTTDHGEASRDIEYLAYSGLTVKVEGVAGYFFNRNFAAHGGVTFYAIPNPYAEIQLRADETIPVGEQTVGRSAANSPDNTTFGMLNAGVTGYTLGDVFISGSAGLGFGGVDDPKSEFDFISGAGFGFNVVIGKDFQIDKLLGFGVGGYLDVVVQPTEAGYTMTHVTLGIQSHGILRFR